MISSGSSDFLDFLLFFLPRDEELLEDDDVDEEREEEDDEEEEEEGELSPPPPFCSSFGLAQLSLRLCRGLAAHRRFLV